MKRNKHKSCEHGGHDQSHEKNKSLKMLGSVPQDK